MIAAKPSFGDNLWDPVIMIGPLGLKRGQLSNLPGSIMRGNSKSFVKTYMLEFDEVYGKWKESILFPYEAYADHFSEVCEGDSGAWVVHHAGLEVFGHVVATDILGDAYIMPAVETFDEIRDYMNAASVKLPSYGESNNNTSVITKIPLTATSLESQNHFHGHPSCLSCNRMKFLLEHLSDCLLLILVGSKALLIVLSLTSRLLSIRKISVIRYQNPRHRHYLLTSKSSEDILSSTGFN